MSFDAGAVCSGKRRFVTFTLAGREAKRMRRAHCSLSTPYHCGHCGGYHVGTRGLERSARRYPAHDER